MLLPQDPNDERNVFLEIRAGTGGDESALFAGSLLPDVHALRGARGAGRSRSCPNRRPSSAATRRSILRDHRARRVLRSSSSSRAAIACSACRRPRRRGASTRPRARWRCMPEADPVADIDDQPRRHAHRHVPRVGGRRAAHQQDRFGGADHASADRHRRRMPGRPVAASQSRAGDGGARVAPARQASCASGSRRRPRCARALIGSGDRSERIRTYNFPQGRVTDHRINLTLHKIDAIMDGDLDELTTALAQEHQAEQLAALAGEER